MRTEGSGRPWVRFGPLAAPPGPGPPWLLELWCEFPNLFGEVEVQEVVGVHPGILDVLLAGPAEVRGLVWSEDTDAPIAGVTVTMNAADGRPRAAPERHTPTSADGTFRFTAVRAGSYTLAVFAGGYPHAHTTLEVLPGETVEHEFRLSAGATVGRVSGTLTSVTGRYSMPVGLVLTPAEGGISFHHDVADVAWEERDGSMVAPFVFEDVPYGEYRLSIARAHSRYLWEPRAIELRCPEEGLVLLCKDDIEPIDVRIRAFDAGSGQELPSMWVFVDTHVDGERVSTSAAGPMPSGVPVGYVIPGRTNLDWVVGAPGCGPVRGDQASLTEISTPTGAALEAKVHLEPGWGVLVEVLGPGGDPPGRPVAGAQLYADGSLVGTTTADGRFLLQRPRAPEKLEVKASSSNVAVAELFDEEGRLLPRFMLHGRVWMR